MNFFCVKSYFNVINMSEKNHEKIQLVGNFFGLQLYYIVKNNKNIKLQS